MTEFFREVTFPQARGHAARRDVQFSAPRSLQHRVMGAREAINEAAAAAEHHRSIMNDLGHLVGLEVPVAPLERYHLERLNT